MKQIIEEGEENEKDEEEKGNKNGLEVSSDEEDGHDEDKPEESQVSLYDTYVNVIDNGGWKVKTER